LTWFAVAFGAFGALLLAQSARRVHHLVNTSRDRLSRDQRWNLAYCCVRALMGATAIVGAAVAAVRLPALYAVAAGTLVTAVIKTLATR